MLLKIIAELTLQDIERGETLQVAITNSINEVMVRRGMTQIELTERIKEECQSGD